MKKITAFEELETELQNDPEYRKAERKTKPYYDLALEIIRRRNSLGLTQKELAEKAQTYQSRISKIESSEFDIRLSTLINIAEALDTQVAIKLLPTSDSYYDDKLYQGLFKTNIIQQEKPFPPVPKPQYSMSFKLEGNS